MKLAQLTSFYAAILLIIFGGIVLHAPLTVWLGTVWPEQAALIKSWKELLMMLAVAPAIIIVTRRGLWRDLITDWIFRLIVGYAVLHVLLAIALPRDTWAMLAGFAIDLRHVLFFSLVYVLIRVAPQWRKQIVYVGGIGAALVVGFAMLQLFLPKDTLSYIGYSRETIAPYLTVDENPDYIRYSSTLRGPNPLGAYAGIVLGMVTALLVRGKLQLRRKAVLWTTLALAVCSVGAVWVSYSRSALVAAIITVILVLAVTVARRFSRRTWIIATAVCFALLGGLVAARDSNFVANVLLHENPTTGAAISSNEGHVESLVFGVERMAQQPFGAGVGSTGSASLYDADAGGTIIENQYLYIAHETGWLGLGLFTALFTVIMYRLWRARADWLALGAFASGAGLAMIGLLLPVWADDTVAIIWWALAAAALGGDDEQ
jgi:hypothetical protein